MHFERIDDHHARVELEHRGLGAYGDKAAEMRDAFDSPNGWNGMLEHYAVVAAR